MTRTIEISAFAVAGLVAALAVHAWLASRDDQRRLQATLDAQQKIVSEAVVREGARDASLAGALSQIAKLKAAVQTPQEIVRDLPNYLALPQPITLSGEPSTPSPAPQGYSNSKLPSTQAFAAAVQGPSQKGTGAPNSPGTTEPASPKIASDKPSDGASPLESSAIGARLSPTASIPASTSGTKAEIPAADLKPLYDYVQDCRATQAQLAVAQQNATDDASRIAAISRERDAAVTASKGGNFWKRLRRNAEWFAVGAAAGAVAASAIHTSR
jgi:hypothetical protein